MSESGPSSDWFWGHPEAWSLPWPWEPGYAEQLAEIKRRALERAQTREIDG